MTSRLVIIGGDAAGMSAAAQARRLRGPGELEIVVFERGHHVSFSACGIPYWIGGTVESIDDLVSRTVTEHREKYDLDVRMRCEVTSIDTDREQVIFREVDSGEIGTLGYDQLLIATGAVPNRPPIPGIDALGVYGVQTLDDGAVVRRAVDAGAHRAVVVGAGYIGLEMAEAFVQRGLDVTIVTSTSQPMPTIDPDMGALVASAVRGLGINLRCDSELVELATENGKVRAAITRSAGQREVTQEFPADIVVLGLGVRPASDLARDAGISVGETGGIATTAQMRTRLHDNVWAAGDCVETIHRVSLAPVTIALGTHANKQGRIAGTNLGGGYATFPGVLGTAATKVCDLEIARTGLSAAQATQAGFAVAETVVESTTRAGYFPGATSITTKLIAERGTGRLLGAQIVGREGAAKRIDVLATALWNAMTVSEIADLDLSYAPPFAPVWDPVLIAARKAAGR